MAYEPDTLADRVMRELTEWWSERAAIIILDGNVPCAMVDGSDCDGEC